MSKLDDQLKDVMSQMNSLKEGGLKSELENMKKQVSDLTGPIEE
jgi:hypothetical protein